MTTHKSRKTIKDFFEKADAKNLIVYKNLSTFPETLKQIIKNCKDETRTFVEFNEVFQDPKKLTTMTGFISKKFKISDESTTRLMSNYFVFFGLNYLETRIAVLR